jgi:hypothetical protein
MRQSCITDASEPASFVPLMRISRLPPQFSRAHSRMLSHPFPAPGTCTVHPFLVIYFIIDIYVRYNYFLLGALETMKWHKCYKNEMK